jgi:hypothetical protein
MPLVQFPIAKRWMSESPRLSPYEMVEQVVGRWEGHNVWMREIFPPNAAHMEGVRPNGSVIQSSVIGTEVHSTRSLLLFSTTVRVSSFASSRIAAALLPL